MSASREVVAQAKAQQLRLIGPERRWIDTRATGPVAYVYDGGSYWNTVWETLFWNRRVESVLDLPDNVVPGPLPQTRISVRPNGVLTDPAGAPFGPPFAVIAENYQLAGQPLATAPSSAPTGMASRSGRSTSRCASPPSGSGCCRTATSIRPTGSPTPA